MVKGGSNGADPAVHHVAGSHDVSSRFGVTQGLGAEQAHGFIVEDGAIGRDQAVVTIAVVRIEGDVGDDGEFG